MAQGSAGRPEKPQQLPPHIIIGSRKPIHCCTFVFLRGTQCNDFDGCLKQRFWGVLGRTPPLMQPTHSAFHLHLPKHPHLAKRPPTGFSSRHLLPDFVPTPPLNCANSFVSFIITMTWISFREHYANGVTQIYAHQLQREHGTMTLRIAL